MLEQKDTRVFKLTNFSPIGFQKIKYPVQYCTLCRGDLTEVCSTCMEKHCEKCDVVNNNGTFYHNHCLEMINRKPVETKKKKKAKYDSDSD